MIAPMSKLAANRRAPAGRASRSRCRQGRHLPDAMQRSDERGLLRTRCRLCDAELVQLFGRSWIVSGKLG
jgi:hypothetical protein